MYDELEGFKSEAVPGSVEFVLTARCSKFHSAKTEESKPRLCAKILTVTVIRWEDLTEITAHLCEESLYTAMLIKVLFP